MPEHSFCNKFWMLSMLQFEPQQCLVNSFNDCELYYWALVADDSYKYFSIAKDVIMGIIESKKNVVGSTVWSKRFKVGETVGSRYMYLTWSSAVGMAHVKKTA